MSVIRKMMLTIAAVILLAAKPAFADATAFLGANTEPSTRAVKGIAAGVGFAIFAIELEYAVTSEEADAGAPALKTGMANGLIQTPFPILRLQPYLTGGGGIYRETLDATGDQQTSFGLNVGGGVKVSLIGPLRLRLDYRVFRLGSGALFSPAHRVYAGLNLKF